MKLKNLLAVLFVLLFLNSFGQTSLPIPTNLNATYTKGTRTPDGKPGPNYWQNKADYLIKVNFDPKSRLLSGVVDIDYTNNSPDSLNHVYFKLYPNFYLKGTKTQH
jgi:hypothetical protein